MEKEFQRAVALVTGATAGIGQAIAVQLGAEGATVVVHGRNAERGAETVDRIVAGGGTARFIAADLGDPDDVARLAEDAGDVEILVNNAAIYEFGPTAAFSLDQFDKHYATNTRAPFQLVAALAPKMAERGHGVIVNISTGAVATPVRGAGVYVSSKAAVDHLTQVWADEYGPAGIRVNTVASGPVRTLGLSSMGEEALQAMGSTTIAGRVAEPEEIAEAVSFLASDRASYVNGAIIDVRGGRLPLGA